MNQLSGMKLIASYYWHELKKHPWHVVLMLLMVPTAVFLNIFAIPYIIAGIIDTLSKGNVALDQVWATFGDDIILFTLAIVAGELILWRLIVFMLWRLEKKIVFDLYMRCFDFLTRQSAQFHADSFSGSLVSQTNKFTSSYIRLIDSIVFQILPFICTLVFTFIILGVRVPLFAIGLAVLSGIFIWINAASYGRIRHLNEVESEANNKMSGHIADMIGNVLAVKSFSAEGRETKRFLSFNKTAAAATENVLQNSIKRDVGFGSVLVVVMVFMLIFILVGQATLGITIGTMVLMLSYSLTLFNQLWTVQQITRNYNRVYGDALPMAKVLQSDITVEDARHPEKLRIKKGAIALKNITFTHDGSKEALFKQFNLTVKPGERIGLVGHSGSGKTTLTKLLLRFADIDGGVISIDGQDIRAITQHDLRTSIAYVPQEPLLFHRSLKENIAYGKIDATDEEIRDAAEKAHALGFIEKLPKGFDTLVGERGVKLSGGQRQRVAIARAILKDAPILVLDEATSALDSESEKAIQAALRELMKGRTTIAIAHRLSTVQHMDRILVLDNGVIAEVGSHKDLLAQDGIYASLWKHQSGGFIES